MPVEALSITTDKGSYVLSPADPMTITIADTTPPAGTFHVDVSFDEGATWSNVTVYAPLGPSDIGSMVVQPDAVATSTALLRVTNPDTTTTAVSDPFTLVGDAVVVAVDSEPNTNEAVLSLTYQSDAGAATFSSVDPATLSITGDTTGGNQPADTVTQSAASQVDVTFASDLSSGGVIALTSAGDLVFDRRAAALTPPISAPIP